MGSDQALSLRMQLLHKCSRLVSQHIPSRWASTCMTAVCCFQRIQSICWTFIWSFDASSMVVVGRAHHDGCVDALASEGVDVARGVANDEQVVVV